MTTNNFADVGAFHEKFGLPNTQALGAGPINYVNLEGMLEFRKNFLQEEFDEFVEGLEEQDMGKMADALIDLVYIAMGTAQMLGLPWDELWDDVQAANMRKVRAAPDGSNSKRSSSLDVVKPAGWVGPDTNGILKAHGFEVIE